MAEQLIPWQTGSREQGRKGPGTRCPQRPKLSDFLKVCSYVPRPKVSGASQNSVPAGYQGLRT
jgi:hypothetical protein